jgi:hypothetical protein
MPQKTRLLLLTYLSIPFLFASPHSYAKSASCVALFAQLSLEPTWTRQEAYAHAMKSRVKEIPKNESMKEAFVDYVRDGPMINRYLRGYPSWFDGLFLKKWNKEILDGVKKSIKGLDRAFQLAPPLPKDLILFRGEYLPKDFELPKVGKAPTEKGYTSTSVELEKAMNFVTDVPDGAPKVKGGQPVLKVIRIGSSRVKGIYLPVVYKAIPRFNSVNKADLMAEAEVLLNHNAKRAVTRVYPVSFQGMPVTVIEETIR